MREPLLLVVSVGGSGFVFLGLIQDTGPREDVAKDERDELAVRPVHAAARLKVLLHADLPVLFLELVKYLVPQHRPPGIPAQHRQVPEH